jgi:Ca2+/Na+ antiporter
MPELATSLLSALDGKTSFAVDNVIGSNIANTLLI